MSNKSGNPHVHIFRKSHEKYNRDLVNLRDHVKPSLTVMMWAGIWSNQKTPLVIMERDSTSQSNGYISQSYQNALREGLLPVYDGTRIFIQDNAPIHTSAATMQWLLDHQIELRDWPPHSPDLNPIEHVWGILKRNLRTMFPHLSDLRNNQADREEFNRCVQLAWAAIRPDQISRLVNSMERRLRACIRARGWYTRY